MNNAGAPFVHIRNHEPLETRKNQNELLLQEDTLLFLLQCKYLFTPSNFTSAACLFATSEGRLYRSYIDFFRTDIPSSQYNIGIALTSYATYNLVLALLQSLVFLSVGGFIFWRKSSEPVALVASFFLVSIGLSPFF